MIHVRSSTDRLQVPAAVVRRAARAALERESAEGELSVMLSDDAHVRDLNRDHLGIDAPTDVLSFPASETDPQSGRTYLGDIIISVPRAAEQAQAAGHSLADEVQLLVIHGVLHLLGYDHARPAEKSRMWAEQEAILESVGLGDIVIRES
ncbi:MAG TPA: rRNA maturation RNase YbeY [Anaerolineales bacterium]